MEAKMQTGSLFTRDDTFFGICEALGQDLGFNANLLRVTLGIAVLWNPAVVLSVYAGLGVLVAVSRFAFPDRRRAAAPEVFDAPARPQPAKADDHVAPDLALAA
jgi:phage shock protein C